MSSFPPTGSTRLKLRRNTRTLVKKVSEMPPAANGGATAEEKPATEPMETEEKTEEGAQPPTETDYNMYL